MALLEVLDKVNEYLMWRGVDKFVVGDLHPFSHFILSLFFVLYFVTKTHLGF